MSTEATVARLMGLVENHAFEAGKSAIYVAQGGQRNTPDHAILKQGFNRTYEALEAAMREALDLGEPVAWRAKAQCGMYSGMFEFSEDAKDLIDPQPLYAPKAKP